MQPIIQQLAPHALRVRRGFERTVLRRRPVTDGHRDTARETGVMLHLMREASTGPELTVERQLFLSQSAVGMRARASVLLSIPNRSLVEERELAAINGWLAEEAQRNEPAPHIVPRTQPAPALGFLGPVGAIAGVRLWMVLAAGWAVTGGAVAIQTARLNNAKGDLAEARGDVALAQQERDAWRERAGQYAEAVADARETAEMTAQQLNQERRRQAAAARRERERQRNVQDLLARSTQSEPPPWDERLRNDQPVQE